MSVRVRPYRRGGWEADVRVLLPDGREHRERRRVSVSSKSAATRWAEARERELLVNGLRQPTKEVPTLEQFAPGFLDKHARAEQQKPSGIAHKETQIRVHLIPQMGDKRLDTISAEDVQLLKHHLRNKAPKTVNNVLTVLNTLLTKAVEWEVIDAMPCRVRLLKPGEGSFDFYDFDEYERFVAAARRVGSEAYIVALLGGEAGLRAGEMRAMLQVAADVEKGQLRVERSEWRECITTTKGNRIRYVPMTARLRAALRAHRHLRGDRLLYREDGRPMTESALRELVVRTARLAMLRGTGPHILRHTFCSHLAMRGAPVRGIQELAGHRHLSTTMRYMHLSPAAKDSAIRLLETSAPRAAFGDILETGDPAI